MTTDPNFTDEETELAGLLLGTQWYSTISEEVCRVTRASITEMEGLEKIDLRLEYRHSEQNGVADIENFRVQVKNGDFEPHSADCEDVLEFIEDREVPA